MFANTQMPGAVALSPLRALGLMARRTTDQKSLQVIQAGLEAMLLESRKVGAFSHDLPTASMDLAHVKSAIGR